MVASAHHVIPKEVENRVLKDKCIFRHTGIYKQHKLTGHWNYNNFVQILYSYLRYTDRLCGCVFLVARCNIIRASWELRKNERLSYRKKYTEKFGWGISLFWLHALLLMSLFVAFFHLFSLFLLLWIFLEKTFLLQRAGACPPSVYSLCEMIIILSS